MLIEVYLMIRPEQRAIPPILKIDLIWLALDREYCDLLEETGRGTVFFFYLLQSVIVSLENI